MKSSWLILIQFFCQSLLDFYQDKTMREASNQVDWETDP